MLPSYIEPQSLSNTATPARALVAFPAISSGPCLVFIPFLSVDTLILAEAHVGRIFPPESDSCHEWWALVPDDVREDLSEFVLIGKLYGVDVMSSKYT